MDNLFSTGIRPTIDAHIEEEAKKLRDYGDYWSASSAGYCMRLNIMRRLGVPPVPEILESKPRVQRVFSAGHIFHDWIQGLTKEAGLSTHQELELIDDTIMVKGHCDDLVEIDGNKIVYDYKTVNSQSFKYKKDKISHYHRMQLGTYLYMLRKEHKDLVESRVMNISKDDLRLSEFQLMWTPDLEKDVVSYWTTLNGYWKDKKLPKCTCADYEGGFMFKRSSKGVVYNDYFYENEGCSLKWFELCKKQGLVPGLKNE